MGNSVKIAVAQMNCVLGDLAGNAAKILDCATRAKAAGAELLLTPELSLCGYPPEDLLLRDGFFRDCAAALDELAAALPGIKVIVGHPQLAGGRRYNAASVLQEGRVAATYRKRNLPNYTVFDEERYFEPGSEPAVFEVNGVRLGLNICEDLWGEQGPVEAGASAGQHGAAAGRHGKAWHADAPRLARAAGAQVLLVLNASPYHTRQHASRLAVARNRAAETGLAIVYANMVGGQDELVFDGASFALDARGEPTHQLPFFEEALDYVDIIDGVPQPGSRAPALALEAAVYRALCLGVRDYLGKNGFPGAILGLSGGVDSALTLAIACDALGADKVRAVMMPSQYTADISWLDSRAMVKRLGVRYDEIPIRPVFDAFLAALESEFEGRAVDATEENLQARIRGTLLMALSNKFGSIVLTTGNKSEMAVGYSTLYGDMAGGFAVIKDVAKTLVYRLAEYRNSLGEVIPRRIIERAPSAELRPDQTDQDSLPPYEVLDAIMSAYMEQNLAAAEIIAGGQREEDVRRVVGLIKRNEYKRRQAPVGIRITQRGFGKDWRYPITSRYREKFGG
ncbi:MAG: NAD+ synthase [Betaproteobacteria bacterium]|nr:MAG: NAD+ synthase [Betaproteobacteria bacterium]